MRRRSESKDRRSIERRDGAPGGAAPTPTGAEASPASRRGRSQGSAKAGLANPLAPPGAPSLLWGERKKGKDAPASINRGRRSFACAAESTSFRIESRERGLGDHDILLDARAAGRDRADHLAIEGNRKATWHVGEVAHAHRHADRVFLRRVAGWHPLRGGCNRFSLRRDDREM